MNLFYFQLVASFFVGGGFIALLSLLAEKSSSKMAGLILSLPSTGALSYLFISWTIGPDSIPHIAPTTAVSMGSIMFFTIAYLYLSRLKLKKLVSIAVSLCGAVSVWLGVALLLKKLNFSNLYLGILVYLFCCLIGYYFLTVKNKTENLAQIVHYNVKQKLSRAFFAGTIITLAVYLSKTLNPIWGGLLAGYPAAFTSTLLILHHHHNSEYLFRIFKSIPVGFMPPLAFLTTSAYTFPAFGTAWGFLVAYLAAIFAFLILSKLRS